MKINVNKIPTFTYYSNAVIGHIHFVKKKVEIYLVDFFPVIFYTYAESFSVFEIYMLFATANCSKIIQHILLSE